MPYEEMWLRLTQVGLAIAQHSGKPSPKPHALYRAVLDGRIPAKFESNRWVVRKADVPLAAAAFGIDWPKKPVSAADRTPAVA